MEMNNIVVVHVENGAIQMVESVNENIQVIVVDYDTDGLDSRYLTRYRGEDVDAFPVPFPTDKLSVDTEQLVIKILDKK